MKNRYQQTTFLTSANELRQLPDDEGWEVAFAGRSNAGKSSALNAICTQRGLARTSKTPGRTQMINYFSVRDDRHLVDLPGYGFAKVPHAVKEHWQRVLEGYLIQRECLRGLILLMDVRHPLTELDQNMLAWSGSRGLPCHVLLTKSDKLKRGAAANTLQGVRSRLTKEYPLSSVQLFSSVSGAGLDEVRALLDAWLELE